MNIPLQTNTAHVADSRRKFTGLVSCDAWSLPTVLPTGSFWEHPWSLSPRSAPVLMSLSTANSLAYCWAAETNQPTTQTDKYWCKRGQKVHVQVEGGEGKWVRKKAREGETAFSYRVHFQRELQTTPHKKKSEDRKINMVSFYKCKNLLLSLPQSLCLAIWYHLLQILLTVRFLIASLCSWFALISLT